MSLRLYLYWMSAFFVGFLSAQAGPAATLPFQFTLDEAATTSAGVFKTDGTLVRTLWRKVDYARGDHSAVWDGLTDEQAPAAPGDYSIRILSNHVDYVWQGAIGNTSSAMFGSTVHRGFGPIHDMVITGTDAFYITGYVEGDFDFRHFSTTNPQVVDDRWCWYVNPQTKVVENKASNIFDSDWCATATDGTWVYFASPDSTDPTTRDQHVGPGFIVASLVSSHQSVSFTKGASIPNGPVGFPDYPGGIKVGVQKGLSGLAVETNGNTLAASVQNEGRIYLFDKRSGASIRSIKITSPGALSFAPNGDLWVVSGTNIKKITTPATAPAITTPIQKMSQPLDVAVSPDGTLVAVLDAGGSQQVKAFSPTGAPAWTLGQPGGYSVNGPDVTRDKFMFFDKEMITRGSVTFAPDGSFWVNDPGNRRTLHYAADQTYLEEIMFQNTSYSSAVDANNPSRVFCDFLEFSVDYTQPLAQGWRLVKNWGANLPKTYFGFSCGVRQVTTLSNGRTYASVGNDGVNGRELVELTPQGTRLTGMILADSRISPGKFETLAANGNVRRGTLADGSSSATRCVFEEKPLTGFNAQNNPQWGAYATLATVPLGPKDPATRCCSLGDPNIPITTSDIIVSFDQTINPGWHLGGVRKGGSDWLWKASPSVTSNVPLDGLGSFDVADGVNYPGNTSFASGRNIFFGYHGEFWNQTQACQFMHFYDDGLFVGQFGESGWGHEDFEITVPGRAGNGAFACITEANGKVYLWTNDESQHGPQRWLISGDKTIRESSASGTLGQIAPVLIPAAVSHFPTNVQAQPGDGRVSLSWNAVAGATGYIVRLSTTRGGNTNLVDGNVAGTGKTIGGLTNGQPYYFTVSALGPNGESVESDPVSATPASLSKLVDTAGRYDQPGRIPDSLTIASQNPVSGLPALFKLNPLVGNLTLNSIGSAGYQLFRWNPTTLADLANLPAGDKIEPQDGWKTLDYLGNRFKVDGVLGSNNGLFVKDAGGTGTINITPSDSGLYYLTVAMPARFRNEGGHNISLYPLGASSEAASYSTHDRQSINHIYQFRFRGPVTLSVQSTVGDVGIQGIFLDRASLIPQEDTGYFLWEMQNFTPDEMTDPTLSDQTADYDHDGQSNLMEYALGTSPKQVDYRSPTSSNLQKIQGVYYLTLQYVHNRSADDLILRVGVNSSLTNADQWIWIDPEDPIYLVGKLVDIPARGLDTITVRDIVPATTGPRFMKLSVTQP